MGIAALKKQGYTIQTQTLNGAANMAEALASNRAQFSYDNVIGIVKAVTGGAGMKLIYDVGGNTVVWAVKKTFKDCSKLTGQPVGIFGPPTSSAYTNEMEHYFSLKCPGTSPNLVTIPTSTLRVQALLNGQIVGTALSTGPAGVLFQKAPKGEFVTVAMSKLIPGVADNYLIANQQVLKSDPKAVKALVKACLAAAHQIYAGNKAHFLALVKKYSPAGSYTKTSALTLYTQKIFYADGGLKESGFTTNLTKTLTLFHLTGSPSALATSKILKSVSGK